MARTIIIDGKKNRAINVNKGAYCHEERHSSVPSYLRAVRDIAFGAKQNGNYVLYLPPSTLVSLLAIDCSAENKMDKTTLQASYAIHGGIEVGRGVEWGVGRGFTVREEHSK